MSTYVEMNTLEDVSKLARELTLVDLKRKDIFQLFAKMMEEVGEFAQELQIEESVFGNTHKPPDEGSVGEAVDMIIMGLALYHARNKSLRATTELVSKLERKLNKWKKRQQKELKGK